MQSNHNAQAPTGHSRRRFLRHWNVRSDLFLRILAVPQPQLAGAIHPPDSNRFRNRGGDEPRNASIYNVMGKFWRRGGD
jgi:hypothetical protein